LELPANDHCSLEESIREDVAILRNSPLIKKTTQIIGLSLDLNTGKLTEVN
jgi:carbonic anhydrase